VVYSGWEHGRKERLGWERSTFFKKMAQLVHAGLAEKDQWGNYALLKTGKVSQKHKCTVKVDDLASEAEIRSVLILKLFEMGYRQTLRGWKHEGTSKGRRSRIMENEAKEKAGTSLLEATFADVGYERECFVKLAADNYMVPMNTDRLLYVTGLSRGALFAWKAQAREKGWIAQQNFSSEIPPKYERSIDMLARPMEVSRRGRVVPQKNTGRLVFVQASCYKPLLSY
jgi:hypothetical protein